MTRKKLMSYEDMLANNPNQYLFRANVFFQEKTPEETENSRLRQMKILGWTIKFFQDNKLTRRELCANAPDISADFCLYLRDITPEGLEFYRTGHMKWLKRFERNMHADPSDVRVMEKALDQMRSKKLS